MRVMEHQMDKWEMTWYLVLIGKEYMFIYIDSSPIMDNQTETPKRESHVNRG